MTVSRLDRVYRNLVLSKFFIRGWGNPDNIKRLFEFRRIVADREKCQSLVDPDHPVFIDKEEDCGTYRLIHGHFASPLAAHLPGVVPKESETAFFQFVVPKKWTWPDGMKPVVVHLAGTGDHYFWRRRMLMAKPLISEWNVASIILENPFYGLRKPKAQKRSCLHNVSDIFVMGGCLILESLVLFHWCRRSGFGPLGITGVSMGGHMASLAASSWPEPIVLVPCLSWSTASSVFTKGVMSAAIDWSLLESQFSSNQIYRDILAMILETPQGEFALEVGRQMAQLWSRSALDPMTASVASPALGTEHGRQQALLFMRGIMDEFTHIANYSVPVDCSSVIIVTARDDAYVPRDGTVDLTRLWPGSEIRFLPTGHIGAYVLHHQIFRRAVKDALDRLISKHHDGGHHQQDRHLDVS